MTVSFNEALDLLRKWMIESTGMLGSLTMDGATMEFGGSIIEVTSLGFILSQVFSSGHRTLTLFVALGKVLEFNYHDACEAPIEVQEAHRRLQAVLYMKLPNGNCCLYEMKAVPRDT